MIADRQRSTYFWAIDGVRSWWCFAEDMRTLHASGVDLSCMKREMISDMDVMVSRSSSMEEPLPGSTELTRLAMQNSATAS